tara:strand:+ start:2870 stop:3406 length:537 start_codon:yes stop_codon:yes gene_type:complete
MAILRAGPFAISSNSFFDEPATAGLTILPVNCAIDTSSASWPWKRYESRQFRGPDSISTTQSYKNGLPSDSQAVQGGGTGATAARVSLLSSWEYQATQDFNITFTYSSESSITGGGFDNARASVNVNGVEVFLDEDTTEVNGSTTITLPASVVPSTVGVGVFAQAGRGGTAEASYSVS